MSLVRDMKIAEVLLILRIPCFSVMNEFDIAEI